MMAAPGGNHAMLHQATCRMPCAPYVLEWLFAQLPQESQNWRI